MTTKQSKQLRKAIEWFNFGLRVIPLKPGGKETAVKWPDWLQDLDADKITAYWTQNPKHGIGAITSDEIYILDADDPEAIGAIEAIEADHFVECNQVHLTKKGQHRFYRRAPGTSARMVSCSTDKHPAGIDVRTSRGSGTDRGNGNSMVVLPPTGGRSIERGVDHISELAEVGQDFIDAVTGHNAATSPAPIPKPRETAKAFSGSPNEYLPEEPTEPMELLKFVDPDQGYQEWIRAGMALHAETQGSAEGLAIWDTWSSCGETYAGPGETEYKWSTFQYDPFGDRPQVSMSSLAGMARDGGADLSAVARHFKGSNVLDAADQFRPDDAAERRLVPTSFSRTMMADALQARDWQYGYIALRRFVSFLIGRGGVAKSITGVGIGVSAATGVDFLGLGESKQISPRRVLLLNLEDDDTEMRRRIQGTCLGYGLEDEHLDLLEQNLEFKSGYGQQLRLAVMGEHNNPEANKALVEELIALAKGFDIVILDPLVGFHGLPENDNGAMDHLVAILRRIGAEGGCAVIVVHHSSKAGVSGDADSASRGASSITDAGRGNRRMIGMTTDEATSFGIAEDERRRYVRVDDGKQNYSMPSAAATWLYLHSIDIPARHPETGEMTTESIGFPRAVALETQDTAVTISGFLSQLLNNPEIDESKFTASDGTPYLRKLAVMLERDQGVTAGTVQKHLDVHFPQGRENANTCNLEGIIYRCFNYLDRTQRNAKTYCVERVAE